MATITKKVQERIVYGLKQFQPIITSAKNRDVNEADTVTVVTDILSSVFGYDKYTDLTSEMGIRGTYCDIAIKLEGKIQVLIEIKAIGLELKPKHLKQVVDYAANQGIEWTVLTNGNIWQIHRVVFAKPIDHELVAEFALLELDPKNDEHLELAFLLSKEGWAKSAMGEFETRKQALSRFLVGAVVLSEPVLRRIRRELRRVSPDVRVDMEQISGVLSSEVLKREVIEGESFVAARKLLSRATHTTLREKREEDDDQDDDLPLESVSSPVQTLTP